MSDKYFNADMNRAMLQEYMELCNESPRNFVRGEIARKRQEDIRQHIAFEVIAQFADLHGKET